MVRLYSRWNWTLSGSRNQSLTSLSVLTCCKPRYNQVISSQVPTSIFKTKFWELFEKCQLEWKVYYSFVLFCFCQGLILGNLVSIGPHVDSIWLRGSSLILVDTKSLSDLELVKVIIFNNSSLLFLSTNGVNPLNC